MAHFPWNDPIMDDILNTHFAGVETLVAIDQLKGNRSAGANGIPAEVFKNLRHLLVPTLTSLFNYCLEKGEYPEGWSEGVITPIHKGGETVQKIIDESLC